MGSRRRATGGDAPGVRGVLARAFVDDPLIIWALPDEDRRLAHAEAWLGWFLDAYRHDAAVDCVDARAVALWLAPHQDAATPPRGAPRLSDLLATMAGRDHAREVLSRFATTGPRRPPEPHVYLHVLAVDPSVQGQGLGARVLARILGASAAEQVPVHLESANPRNHSFYARLGFRPVGVNALGDPGEGFPTLTSFRRPPDPAVPPA